MTVYRIVWVRPSGEEVPDVDTFPSMVEAMLHAFRVMTWTNSVYDFDIVPIRRRDYYFGT